jgi:ribosomal protein S18 acetylase RimI-like enzyme
MPDISVGQERLIRLTPDHAIKYFDCEDQDLNDFLLNESKNFANQLQAVTYILENDKETIAFFSLLNDKITIKDSTQAGIWAFLRSIFPFSNELMSYPAVKIGRLAVSKNHKHTGVGTSMISFLIDSFLTKNKTGCRFITVDADNRSLEFYEKNGFCFLTKKDKGKDTRLMYLDLYPYKSIISDSVEL